MKSESIFKVRYAETDRLKRVYYSNYFIYFEVGRTDFLKKYFISYKELEDNYNIFMPVLEAYSKFFKPIEYNSKLYMITELEILSATKFKFTYDLFTKKIKVANGYTTHVFIDNNNKIISFEEFRKIIKST